VTNYYDDRDPRDIEVDDEGYEVGPVRRMSAESPEDDLDSDSNYLIDGVGFAEPGGRSALRAATKNNPRNLPCPTCGRPNRLTPIDVARGYQCDSCADRAERGLDY
jgi:hypothetical protein